MGLAAALHRAAIPVAIVNPVSAKNFGKRRLQRTKSDPADARTLAALGMADQPATREPLAGAEAIVWGIWRGDHDFQPEAPPIS